MMRFLFANPHYLDLRAWVGARKATHALVEALADGGHDCRVLCLRHSAGSVPPSEPSSRVAVSEIRMPRGRHWAVPYFTALAKAIDAWQPTWIVWDFGTGYHRFVSQLARGRLVFHVQNPQWLPCGPFGVTDRARPADLRYLRAADKVIVPSRFLQRYLRRHAGVGSAVQPNLTYGAGPHRRLAQFRGPVMMVNPSDFKGVAIFVELARQLPDRRFVAVRSWGPTDPAVTALPNVRVVEPRADMDRVLGGASVLLVPSLLAEAFGMVVVDALLRGIPVLCSDLGGLPEAGLGVACRLPVKQLSYPSRERSWSQRHIPAQDVGPWYDALHRLLSDRGYYDDRSKEGSAVAGAYVRQLSIAPLLRYLSR